MVKYIKTCSITYFPDVYTRKDIDFIMRKTYALLKKWIFVIAIGLIPVILFGILSFKLCYNAETYSLKIPTVITCIFLTVIVALIVVCAYAAISADGVKVTAVKKDCGFLKFAAYLCSVTMLVGFIYDLTNIIDDPQSYGVFRIIRFILSATLCAYFIVEVFPKRIKNKNVTVPRWLQYTLSVCTVFWGLSGVFSVYFYNGLLTSEIARISQVIIYVLIALFFLFETEVNHLTPKYRAYIFSALALAVLVCAFPIPMLLIPSVQRFSAMELLYPISIGIYAMAKMFALMTTMKRAIKRREDKAAAEYCYYCDYEDQNESAETSSSTAEAKVSTDEAKNGNAKNEDKK